VIFFCKQLSDSQSFQSLILTLIVLCALSMGLETVPELEEQFADYFSILFYSSQLIFAFEIAVRVLAYWPSPRQFFAERWNRFDFVVVALSFLPVAGPFALVARILRVVRVVRVLSVSDRLRGFFSRLSGAFDEALYTGLILLLFAYVFSISGYYLFSELDPARWGNLPLSALSILYLSLLQEVSSFVAPLIAQHGAYLVFFLLYYLIFFGILFAALVSSVASAVSTSARGQELADD
jgi:voltage-gated sodium channel